MKVLIVVAKTETGSSAYSPDVPDCVATGATRDQVERDMREAIAFHFEGLLLESLPKYIPDYVDIRRVNAGLLTAAKDDAVMLELGKNPCALSQAYVHSDGGRQ